MTATAGPIAPRVNRERLVLLGWGRAILLQIAHPLIAAGVYEHSGFRATPWAAAARLHHTVRAMLALSFGPPAAQAAAVDGIRAIHRRVHGTLAEAVGPYAAGTPYSAEDPALVEWVHVTLLDSVPLVYDRLVAPLDPGERDAYCAEAAWVADALGGRPAAIPRTWAATEEAMARMQASGALTVGAQARTLARAVLAPRLSPLVYPVAWANRLVTIGLLPPAIRAQYGFRWNARRERQCARLLRGIASSRRVLPAWLAHWPESRR